MMGPSRLTRRAFLHQGSLTLAGAALGADAILASEEKPRLRVGLVSDLHYADKEPAERRYYRESLRKLEEAAKQFQQEATDAVIELGDIIDAADSVDAEKDHLKVIDSRTCEGGRAVRRRRQCLKCDKRFTTYERVEESFKLMVVKRDGRRVPWDRGKIFSGLDRACFKRPVPQVELQRIVDEVEEEIYRTHDREVPSGVIGEAVTLRLRKLDQVAYVRFASVYRRFATLEELIDEARMVLEVRRYDVPGQGRLFGEETAGAAPAAEPANHVEVVKPAPAKAQESFRRALRLNPDLEAVRVQVARLVRRIERAAEQADAPRGVPRHAGHGVES